MDNDESESKIDWVSYHEANNSDIDVNSVVALVRRVGGELASIDEKKVDGSFRPALQIDKTKLIADLEKSKNPNSSQQPINSPPPEKLTKVNEQFIAPPPLPAPPPVLPTTPRTSQLSDSNLEKRVTRLESATKAFKAARKIKKGVTYTVSSNSMKGQIKDAELLAEFVMSEVAKGVKTITIKLHENSDS
jgi:hypothetical protein